MYTISKEFHFSASHVLNGLPEGHQCGRLHGHNYVIIVTLKSSTLDRNAFVQDYGELKPVKDFIDGFLDHRHLNDVIPGQPSAEEIARFLYKRFIGIFPLLYSISVKETEKTIATYYEE